MSIEYLQEEKIFVLQTNSTTYAFSVYEETPKYEGATTRRTLRSLYWGRKISRAEDFSRPFNWYINGYNDGGKHSHERYASEYVGAGGLFYSEPTLKVQFADGVRDLFLNYKSHEIEKNSLKITLADVYYGIEVDLNYTVFEALDIIARNCVIRNIGSEEIRIEKAFSATVNIPYGGKYYLTSMDSKWTYEYDLHRTEITKARTVIESLGGVSNSQNFPYFAIDDGMANSFCGEIWFGTLAWSGNTKITVEKDAMEQVRVTGGISDDDFAWILKPSNKFTTPDFVLGFTANGFNAASQNLQKYVKATRLPSEWKNKPAPIIYNGWTCFKFDIDEQKLIGVAEKAAKIGAEFFVVDDGWMENRNSDTSGGLGDWKVDRKKFPNGFAPLIRRVNELGMKFGLWIEPEMVTRNSDLFKTHPEWVMGFKTREYEESRGQLNLNLAIDEVKDYIIGVLDGLLKNNNIEYLKWDMNRYISQANLPDAPSGEQRMVWVKYVHNLYEIFKYIRETYPHVFLENCASGGLRADIETLKYSDRINYSDNHDPVDSLYMREGLSYFCPAGYIGGSGHISASGSGFNRRECPLEFKALLGMTGSLGLSVNLMNSSKEELDEIAGYIALAKELRDTVQLGKGYQLRSVYKDNCYCREFVSADGKEVLVFLFAPQLTFTYCFPSIKLFGLDEKALYRVDDSYTMSGEGLMNKGLDPKVYGLGNMVCKLIRIRKIGK
ncbi:MAG: alpha-galactosidase [Clostridia bacterium]|nr:alpha-galactosidase [Clostridia bacterium]